MSDSPKEGVEVRIGDNVWRRTDDGSWTADYIDYPIVMIPGGDVAQMLDRIAELERLSVLAAPVERGEPGPRVEVWVCANCGGLDVEPCSDSGNGVRCRGTGCEQATVTQDVALVVDPNSPYASWPDRSLLSRSEAAETKELAEIGRLALAEFEAHAEWQAETHDGTLPGSRDLSEPTYVAYVAAHNAARSRVSEYVDRAGETP